MAGGERYVSGDDALRGGGYEVFAIGSLGLIWSCV